MKTETDNSVVRWWERAVVATLLIAALFYARSAKSAFSPSNTSCPAKTMQALARIYMSHGEFDKAESLVDKALSSVEYKEESDPASPRYAEASEEKSSYLIDLAWVYKNQGRFSEAEKFCRQGLTLQQKLYYKDHPYIAYTQRILGSIYQAQAKYPQADEALNNAMTIIRKCHLPDDPAVAPFEVDIARLLVAEGKLEQAEEIYERSFLLISDHYGPEHLYTANIFADIAKLYYLQGKLEQAEAFLNCALSIQQQVYGDQHHLLIPNRLTLARIYQAGGDSLQAECVLTKALLAIETKSQYAQPLKGEILSALANLYLEIARFADAETTCREAIELFEKSNGLNNEAGIMALNCLARLQIIQGNYSKGYELACSALTKAETVLDPLHPGVAAVNQTLSLACEIENAPQQSPSLRLVAKASAN